MSINISFYADDLAQQAVWEGIFSAFMEDNPDIILRPQQVLGEDYFQKLQVLMAGGVAPEVMEMESKQVPGFAVRAGVLDLQPYIDTSSVIKREDFIPYQWEKHVHAGAMYGLPFSVSTVVMYYNQTVFEKAGVDLPPTEWDSEAWRYEDFLDTALALTSGEGTSKIYGYMQTRWWPYMFPWVWSNGGRVLNEERTQCTLDDELTQEGLQFLSDLINVHRVWPTPDQATEGMDTMFGTDRVAMTPRTVQNSSIMMATEGLVWNVAPMPRGKGQTALTRAPSDCYCVWSEAPAKDAAWRVAEWITGPAGAEMLLDGGYLMPARLGVATPESLHAALGDTINVEVMIDGTENHTGRQPVTVKWAEMGDILASGYEAVLAGDMTPAEYAAEACAKIDPLLADIPAEQQGWLGD
ncbi:MAG: sugar ABC transporter substrate-binding protein [Anaerolineae bacterium]|nr:sugar ABC transporter substrate-binding protein [Anaerolineae bacterium]